MTLKDLCNCVIIDENYHVVDDLHLQTSLNCMRITSLTGKPPPLETSIDLLFNVQIQTSSGPNMKEE